jgi:DNA-directed RNA polymerase specialized sigma24 family protein
VLRLLPWKREQSAPSSAAPAPLDPDAELAARLLAGDKAALRPFLDRHLSPVYSYVRHRVGPENDPLVAVVVGATFERALRHLKPYAHGRASIPLRLWLFREAGAQLARRRRRSHPPHTLSPLTTQLDILRAHLPSLRADRQAAIALALFEQAPPVDIGIATGHSTGAAMRTLRAGLADLSAALAPTRPGAE